MATLQDRQHLRGSHRIQYGQDRGKIIAAKSHLPEINFGPSDGQMGPKWDLATYRIKRCFGYTLEHASEEYRGGPYHGHKTIDDVYIQRLYRPFDERFLTKDMIKRGKEYRADLRAYHKKRLAEIEKARREGGVMKAALVAAGHHVGQHETGYNDAPWLRTMENQLPDDRLDWMIPGQSYCGFGVLWSYWEGGHLRLPDGMVYTPNIRGYAGKTLGKAHFTLVSPEHAEPGTIVVFDWNPGTGADHVGLARGACKNGMMPTREFNTAPAAGGNQGNGDGCYDKWRPRSLIQCCLDVRAV